MGTGSPRLHLDASDMTSADVWGLELSVRERRVKTGSGEWADESSGRRVNETTGGRSRDGGREWRMRAAWACVTSILLFVSLTSRGTKQTTQRRKTDQGPQTARHRPLPRMHQRESFDLQPPSLYRRNQTEHERTSSRDHSTNRGKTKASQRIRRGAEN